MGKLGIIMFHKAMSRLDVERWINTDFVPNVGDPFRLDSVDYEVVKILWACHRNCDNVLHCYVTLKRV